ncbi:hypothetical protein COV13_01340 [Candidatus Woesearchaeota archaeon CG10_big_fil_rev_8_21_14_0_10_32_9]|nr:MAG: hypothetical protein COV13_01340 [Candidatus Woesearchaeota archaeon CG10_big_fil_rev_8_21_14_0_10_32_9]
MNKQKYPKISAELYEEINNIPRDKFYPFDHDLLWYGLDAIVHFVVMNAASNIDKKDFDNFIKKYDLRNGRIYEPNSPPVGFYVNLKSVSEEIFIPRQKFYNKENRFCFLFSRDYLNYLYIPKEIYTSTFVDLMSKNIKTLTETHWTKEMFQDDTALQTGMAFARDALKVQQSEFNINAKNTEFENRLEKDRIINVTNNLFEYYDKIIN